MEEQQMVNNNDIELLNVNNQIIGNNGLINYNGFKIQKSSAAVRLKKLPGDVYKLCVIALATLSKLVPDFIKNIPGIRYIADYIVTSGEIYVADTGFEKIFENIICPYFGVDVVTPDVFNNLQPGQQLSPKISDYFVLHTQFTNPEGKYYVITNMIKSIITFAVEHPGLVIAGGAVLVGAVIKLITSVVKKIKRTVETSEEEKTVMLQIKDVLKSARKIKKNSPNGKVLVKDLKITFDIIHYLDDYPELRNRISGILYQMQQAIQVKNFDNFEQYRLQLENLVFSFERENNNMLFKKMGLVEDTKTVKKLA